MKKNYQFPTKQINWYHISVRNKGFTTGCPADNQTKKVGCPHPKSVVQSVFNKN